MELNTFDSGNGITGVGLSGSLDIVGVAEVEMEFIQIAALGKSMIVDLSEVSFLASLGMRMLLSAAKKLHADGRKMVLVAPQSAVRAALEIVGFQMLLPVVQTLDEATELISE